MYSAKSLKKKTRMLNMKFKCVTKCNSLHFCVNLQVLDWSSYVYIIVNACLHTRLYIKNVLFSFSSVYYSPPPSRRSSQRDINSLRPPSPVDVYHRGDDFDDINTEPKMPSPAKVKWTRAVSKVIRQINVSTDNSNM